MKAISLFLAALLLGACGTATDQTTTAPTATEVQSRLDAISGFVTTWQQAGDLASATTAAEAAANLVVGPNGPGYGDRNGDGEISGATDTGLLPGTDGTPRGLVLDAIGDAACVHQDVLGGSWDDPEARWNELATAIGDWAPDNNTFPSLASHPMRLVGWATLTQTATLDKAHEYAGHAALHVSVAEQALAGC
jgi:hypothetical protein